MKYKIYKLEEPKLLREDTSSGYESSFKDRSVLEEVRLDYSIPSDFDSMEEAMKVVEENREELRGYSLTIIPIINIPYVDFDD